MIRRPLRFIFFPTRRSSDLSLIRTIHDEVEKKMFDYLSLENMEDLKLARNNILKIKEINNQVNDQLTSEEAKDRKSTRLNSSHVAISYAVFCLKKKTKDKKN